VVRPFLTWAFHRARGEQPKVVLAPPLRKNQLAGVVETPKHESKRNKNKSVETVTFTPPKKNWTKSNDFREQNLRKVKEFIMGNQFRQQKMSQTAEICWI
jgi:hypothetical protein